LAAADLPGVKQTAADAVDFARFTLQLFKDVVLKNDGYLKLITSEAYTHRTYYMGLVNSRNQPDFYAGKIRVVDPSGKEYASFPAQHYWPTSANGRAVELREVLLPEAPGLEGVHGWAREQRLRRRTARETECGRRHGHTRGSERIRGYVAALGGKPVHHTLANHWARVIEMLQAAERMRELADDPVSRAPRSAAYPPPSPRRASAWWRPRAAR